MANDGEETLVEIAPGTMLVWHGPEPPTQYDIAEARIDLELLFLEVRAAIRRREES